VEDLRAYPVRLKEAVAAGEPLNPEIIQQVRSAWGLTIRDGFGQTENVLLLGNFPGQDVKLGAVGGRPPGTRSCCSTSMVVRARTVKLQSG
jgi:acetyl-CoA synthetase